jgi:hypothetical protein
MIGNAAEKWLYFEFATEPYVVVWEKVGSDWKLATDIWNTNK